MDFELLKTRFKCCYRTLLCLVDEAKIYTIDEYSHALWRSEPLDQQLSKTISIKSAIWASLLGNMTHMRLTLSKHAPLSKIAFARPRQSVFDALVLSLGLMPRG